MLSNYFVSDNIVFLPDSVTDVILKCVLIILLFLFDNIEKVFDRCFGIIV